MIPRFRDREQAGQLLAERLRPYADRSDVVVLGLPRGGVPVAFELAKALRAPLDVFVVRKLGVPGHEELAMGAIATGGVRVLNEDVVERLHIQNDTLDSVAAREQAELERREHTYRGHGACPNVSGKVVLLVDDGVATGSTMRAAVRALRMQSPSRIVVAVPTAAPSAYAMLAQDADEMVAVMAPDEFTAVGQWYENFGQTSDGEVRHLLASASHAAESNDK